MHGLKAGMLANKQLLLSRRTQWSGALALQLTLPMGMVVRSRTASPLERQKHRRAIG